MDERDETMKTTTWEVSEYVLVCPECHASIAWSDDLEKDDFGVHYCHKCQEYFEVIDG
jgi:uncharacterized protein YbaR (Trm112 family)